MPSACQQLAATQNPDVALDSLVRSTPQGFDFLLAIRAELSRSNAPSNSPPAHLDKLAHRVLRTLCGRQMLTAEQLTLSDANATHFSLIQQAKSSETVQRAANEEEFRRKLGFGRRVHALVNKAAPGTLLGILYSAIMPGLPSAMRQIDSLTGQPLTSPNEAGCWKLTPENIRALSWLVPGHSEPRDTCVFYSVSTPHPATRGLRLGTRIIYDVASKATVESGGMIKTFTTLSPIPGFVRWLERSNSAGELSSMLDGAGTDAKAICRAALAVPTFTAECEANREEHFLTAASSGDNDAAALISLCLVTSYPQEWYQAPLSRSLLQPILSRLAEHYLLQVHGSSKGDPECKVAAFHLGNGAKMGRILWGADESLDGLQRSASLMVNYVYSDGKGMDGLRETIEVNAPKYAANPGEVLRSQKPQVIAHEEGDRPKTRERKHTEGAKEGHDFGTGPDLINQLHSTGLVHPFPF
jgi:Malonyl-CoA decarboxylase C-terminal domain